MREATERLNAETLVNIILGTIGLFTLCGSTLIGVSAIEKYNIDNIVEGRLKM